MPVFLNTNRRGVPLRKPAIPAIPLETSGDCLRIGLVNNMPDAALEATERQFSSLLNAASGETRIRLFFYALPEVPRNAPARARIEETYSDIMSLRGNRLDALIVSGAEPRAPHLMDEPYSGSFRSLLEWASENTLSTVWSCLAAHLAVLQMDGVGRRRSHNKNFGVMECARLSDHRLTMGVTTTFRVPHSRWNGISADDLIATGYSVLSQTADSGVDMFVKQQKSLFVFFQGHPEYDSDTLLREYRRDVVRFLRQETDNYPSTPAGYFDSVAEGLLSELKSQAMACRNESLLPAVSAALQDNRIENTWRSTAESIYRNWLQYISSRKEAGLTVNEIAMIGDPPSISRSIPV